MILVTMKENYDIIEHVHRFAAWAASRAASRARGHRFKVLHGKVIIEKAGLRRLLAGPHELPDASEMDIQHEVWRNAVIMQANEIVPAAKFTHGVAAKLINVYLKAGLVTVSGFDNVRVGALHPPIDRVLLHKLAEVDREPAPKRARFWSTKERCGWSNFDSEQYQSVIDVIRQKLAHGQPLWTVEEHFQGYRD